MKTNYYYIENSEDENFINAMTALSYAIPCFIELVDLNTLYIEFREEDQATVEKYLTPFV